MMSSDPARWTTMSSSRVAAPTAEESVGCCSADHPGLARRVRQAGYHAKTPDRAPSRAKAATKHRPNAPIVPVTRHVAMSDQRRPEQAVLTNMDS